MSVSLGVSGAIFFLIAIREWLPSWLKIWHIMVAGAVVLLVSGQISPSKAFAAINWDVILYLFAVFSIGTALFHSGISHRIARHLGKTRSPVRSLVAFLATFALLAALLTNDAAAVIGTPIAFILAARTGITPRVFLIGLCATVTIGSMATPIGNPQNLLIAESGDVPAPVFTFLAWLIVPTIVSLAFVIWWLARSLGDATAETSSATVEDKTDEQRIWPYILSFGCLILFVLADSIANVISTSVHVPLGIAAAVACIPAYLFGDARWQIFRDLDWPTLLFFVAMFIVTGALIESGSLQAILGDLRERMHELPITATLTFIGSQIFSNVPFVDMYLKLLNQPDVGNLMMLSAVSTLAGNVFIISAASNVIVVQQADRLGGESFTFWQFTRAVLPIGIFSTLCTVAWILFVESYFVN
ncbi:MAG: SLC13 family permease [Pseudomonadota bacterium]